jgi:hypothetical protein
MYEHKTDSLAPLRVFYGRIFRSITFACAILVVCLAIGVLGYHYLGYVHWLDSLHNAAMILSGMGPVVTITTVYGRLFSSFYAIFSGVVFITNVGIILAPAAHRLFHSLHLEED